MGDTESGAIHGGVDADGFTFVEYKGKNKKSQKSLKQPKV
jgi:hypothetical protein